MPGALQEQPVLRIGHPSGLRGEAEEIGVELVDAVQDRRTADVGRIGREPRRRFRPR